jgi:exodeoxyribonuclease X
MDKTKLIFLDTETTGLGPDDRLFQVAYRLCGEEFEGLFRPPVPITVDAMAVTHVTNRMVADKEPFAGSRMRSDLRGLFASGHVLVAHNARFDADMLRREGIETGPFIDTRKVAYHLDPQGKVPRYNLQYLRYYYDLEVGEAPAHDALGDVRVLERLFDFLFERMLSEKGNDGTAVLEEMLAISARPLLLRKFTFGKYSGVDVSRVAREDASYLGWLLNQKVMARENGGEDDEDWIYTLDYYLKPVGQA